MVLLLELLLDELPYGRPLPIDFILLLFLLILKTVSFEHQIDFTIRLLQNLCQPKYRLFKHLLVFAFINKNRYLRDVFFEIV